MLLIKILNSIRNFKDYKRKENINLENVDNNLSVIKYQNTDNVLQDICSIIESARNYTYKAINIALVERNWLIGYRIAEEELKGNDRADYGKELIKKLAKNLTEQYGKGFDRSNLYRFLSFYKKFPRIVDSVSRQSRPLLSWTHYRVLLQVLDKEAREWYEKEAIEQNWNVRTLQRNISSQYYYRLLKFQSKKPEIKKIENITKKYDNDKLEFVKNPVIAEFLGFSPEQSFSESELESSIISNLQKFLIELGKGYAFVARQFHIHTEKEDLVFYNYILKCFVLIDLKTSKIRHQDIGQMDMYIRMFDKLKKNHDDNPTIGIILCSDTDEDIARYSILHENKQLFASKYKLYLPTKEELRAEIENQKAIFNLQQLEKNRTSKDIEIENDKFNNLK